MTCRIRIISPLTHHYLQRVTLAARDETNPEFWHGAGRSADFAYTLFELDWETFGQNIDGQ